jgi:SAM-dependent methyltransferase
MGFWIFLILLAAAALFAVKAAYVLAVALTVAATGGALYVSTPRRSIQAVLDTLPLAPGQLFLDLGCGDGRALRAARKRFSVRAVGYEINPLAYLKARVCCMARGIEIRYQNFWKESIEGADVVFCYLFPDVMAELSEKVKREAKAGAVVVSFNFPLPAFAPDRVLRPGAGGRGDPIYIYYVRRPNAEAPREPDIHG